MNPSDYRICLDVQAPHGAVELDAKQGDSQRRIFITLTDGGVPYGITEDCRPLLTAKKPDGTVLYNLCRVEQNTAIYPLTRQTTACPGRVRCELRLYSNELTVDEEGKPSADSAQLLTAATFTLLVHPQVCSDEDALSSLPESTQLEQLVSDTQALLTHVQTKLEQGDFVGEKGDPGEKGDKGEKGDRGEKGDPGEVNIDDGQVSEESTWSSMQISAEIHDCVGYYPQNKANSQKAQARENIGALGQEIIRPIYLVSNNSDGRDSVILTSKLTEDYDDMLVNALHLQGNDDGHIDLDTVILRGVHEGIQDADAVNRGQLRAAELGMVDKLCPAFTESGAVVTCQPVEGYPLQVVSSIVPKQNGEPSPENVCPIEGHTEVKLTHTNDTTTQDFTMELGQTVYGGTLDWSTGELTITHCKDVLDGSVNKFAGIGTASGNTYCSTTLSRSAINVFAKAYCSHLKQKQATEYGVFYITGSTNNYFAAYIKEFANVAEANAWLIEQNSNGTPLTVCYEMAEPIKVQLTPQQIVALSGSNTLRSDTGDTTVTGKASPATEIEKLKNAILSLGGNL